MSLQQNWTNLSWAIIGEHNVQHTTTPTLTSAAGVFSAVEALPYICRNTSMGKSCSYKKHTRRHVYLKLKRLQ